MGEKLKKYELIYNDIIHKINNEELKAGDKLPTEKELTKIYNTSRITVNRAISDLKKNSMVVRFAGKGTFINKNLNDKLSKKQKIVPLVIILPEEDNKNYRIFDGIQQVALSNNCIVPFYNTHNLPKIETETLEKLVNLQIDGLLIFPCTEYHNIDILSKFNVKKIPIVFIDRRVTGINGNCISTDNFKAMSGLVQELINRGHKKIASAIHFNQATTPENMRFNGYIKTLIKNNIPIKQEYLLEKGNFHIKYDNMNCQKRLSYVEEYSNYIVDSYMGIEDKPTAICCSNDNDAINIIHAFEIKLGKKPENLIITGFDNLSFEQFRKIPTVEQNFFEIGKTAIEVMLQRISGAGIKENDIYIDSKLLF